VGLAAAATALLTPAVTVNSEKVTPLVVMPKPILSMNVPTVDAGRADVPKHPKAQRPIIILPQVGVGCGEGGGRGWRIVAEGLGRV